jgi:hypothetical protein
MLQNYIHPAAPARKNGVQTTSLQLSLLNFLIEEKPKCGSPDKSVCLYHAVIQIHVIILQEATGLKIELIHYSLPGIKSNLKFSFPIRAAIK